MNTELIYISDIPNNIKPVLLLHELENKWSRMLYLENSFSGMRDAFIYNPTPTSAYFQKGVQRLRQKKFEDNKRLKVYYVWFPPPNVFLTTMIPEGASMLSYIFLENLPKDGNLAEVTADLPFQKHDIKVWDIPERQDKIMVIKLPHSTNAAMRSFVLGTLRNRSVSGFYPNVFEIIVSEEPELSRVMVPKTLKTVESSDSFMANFWFLHSVPARLTVKTLVDSTKLDNIQGCRVFFLETLPNSKLGFVYVPKSLPYNKFLALGEKLRNIDYAVDDGSTCRVSLNEVWFQPIDADPPELTQEEMQMDKPPEFVLTHYLYLHNIPPQVVAAQLSMGCPYSVKLYVFSANDLSTQIGFVVLRGLSTDACQIVVEYFRHLTIGGLQIFVNEIYLKCYDLPDVRCREMEHIPRMSLPRSEPSKKRGINSMSDGNVELCSQGFSNITLSSLPPDMYPLMKSEFLCLTDVHPALSRAAFVFDLGVVVGGCVFISANDQKRHSFIYLPDCDEDQWKRIIGKLAKKAQVGNFRTIHEVYLQSTESTEITDLKGFKQSCFIFIYNLPLGYSGTQLYHESIMDIVYMDTDSGSRSAIATIRHHTMDEVVDECLNYIRNVKISGKPLYAEKMWLADLSICNGQPPEKRIREYV